MSLRCLFALIFAVGAMAGVDDTSTGIDLNRLPHPALTKVRAGTLKPGGRAVFDAMMSPQRKPKWVLRGKGKSGRSWAVHLCDLCFDEVWRADLDGNGTLDYVIFGLGPYGNGRTVPCYSLSILLIDKDGMPVPFFTAVYRGENGDGIKHLVKLEGQPGC